MTPSKIKRAEGGHTPGPWKFQHNDCGHYDIDAGEECLAQVHYADGLYEEGGRAEADACLIAAAPEMLEALKAVAPYLNTMLIEGDPDDEAIGWEWDDEAGGHSKPIDFTMGQIRKVNAAIAKARGEA